jgi:hypothetical protein
MIATAASRLLPTLNGRAYARHPDIETFPCPAKAHARKSAPQSFGNPAVRFTYMPDPWLCVRAFRRVCFYRDEGLRPAERGATSLPAHTMRQTVIMWSPASQACTPVHKTFTCHLFSVHGPGAPLPEPPPVRVGCQNRFATRSASFSSPEVLTRKTCTI